MRTLADIKKDLKAKVDEIKGISPDNEDALKKATEELAVLNREFDQAKQVELAEQRAADEEFDRLQRVEGRNFSLVKFFDEIVSGRGLTGLEKKVADMGAEEYERLGYKPKGHVLPSAFLRASAGQNYTTPADGGNLIQTAAPRYIDALKERMVLSQLGATIMGDLVGTVPFIDSTTFNGGWGKEGATATTEKIAYSKIELTPHRNWVVGAFSKDLLRQTSLDVERQLQEKILDAHAVLIERAAIAGTGQNDQPVGILKTVGIATVAGGTNGAALTWKNVVKMEGAIMVNNANKGRLGYLTNSKVWTSLKTVEKSANTGRFLLDGDFKMLNGYPIEWSNLVPSDLTKGTGTNLSAIIYGNFQDLVIAQWGGLDIVVDPFSLSLQGDVRIVLNAWNDVKVIQPKSFAVITDVITD